MPPPPQDRNAHTDPPADTRGLSVGAPSRAPPRPRAYLLRRVRPRRWAPSPLAPRRMSSGRGGLANGVAKPGGPCSAGAHTPGARASTLGRAFGLLWRKDSVNQTHFWVTAATGGSTLILAKTRGWGREGAGELAGNRGAGGSGPR